MRVRSFVRYCECMQTAIDVRLSVVLDDSPLFGALCHFVIASVGLIFFLHLPSFLAACRRFRDKVGFVYFSRTPVTYAVLQEMK